MNAQIEVGEPCMACRAPMQLLRSVTVSRTKTGGSTFDLEFSCKNCRALNRTICDESTEIVRLVQEAWELERRAFKGYVDKAAATVGMSSEEVERSLDELERSLARR